MLRKILDRLGVKVASENNINSLNAPSVNRTDFVKIFSDILDISGYANLKPKKESKSTEIEYKGNGSFWQDAIINKHYEGKNISLNEFNLTEWIPLSPGTYFLPKSEHQRKLAKNYIDHEKSEFVPEGKEFMVLGGMGSLRLSSKNINYKKYFFLGASSNGITHQGIPVALGEENYKNLIDKIRDAGGSLCNISGTLEVLPESIIKIRYGENIPKFYLLADKVEFIDYSQKNTLESTATIMYSCCPSHRGLEKAWSFCYFDPSRIESLNKAIQWLKEYASRYSGMDNPPILSDFDEYYNHFSNPVEFPLKMLGSGRINPEIIYQYKNYYNFEINSFDTRIGVVNMGDIFKNIQNATIINKSIVKDSFNKVKKEHDEDVAEALLQVADFIVKSGNKPAGILFDQFNQEVNKEQPDKSTLREIWDGIEKTLPTIVAISDVILKLAPLF